MPPRYHKPNSPTSIVDDPMSSFEGGEEGSECGSADAILQEEEALLTLTSQQKYELYHSDRAVSFVRQRTPSNVSSRSSQLPDVEDGDEQQNILIYGNGFSSRGDRSKATALQRKRIYHAPKSPLQKLKLFQDLSNIRIAPTTILTILVLIDMFAVSLVIPLLFQYYKMAGVNSAKQRELLSSVFSSAQIVGGLLMGVLTDAGWMKRRSILYLSFGGSALSYALIVYGGLPALLISRVVVGLVKHTMTVVTTMLTRITTKETRALHMGRLSAASTVAWIVGPSVGALMFKNMDKHVPALTACGLFLVNTVLAAIFLPEDDDESSEAASSTVKTDTKEQTRNGNSFNDVENQHTKKDDTKKSASTDQPAKKKGGGMATIVKNLKSCFSSKVLGAVVVVKLILTWVIRATNYSQLGSFYEDMYGLEPHHRGYISSYQQLLQFLVQSLLVTRVVQWSGGERQTACIFTGILALATVLEAQRSLTLFIVVLCPVLSLCTAMVNLSVQTLVTHVAPTHSIFMVLAALDVLQNAVSVSVPFYRTFLFQFLTPEKEGAASMHGDPDPVSWIWVSSVHYVIAAVVVSYLLLSNEIAWVENDKEHELEQQKDLKKSQTKDPPKKGK